MEEIKEITEKEVKLSDNPLEFLEKDSEELINKIPELVKKAKNGDSDAMVQLGCYYREGKYFEKNKKKAVKLFKKAAEIGNSEAMIILFFMQHKDTRTIIDELFENSKRENPTTTQDNINDVDNIENENSEIENPTTTQDNITDVDNIENENFERKNPTTTQNNIIDVDNIEKKDFENEKKDFENENKYYENLIKQQQEKSKQENKQNQGINAE